MVGHLLLLGSAQEKCRRKATFRLVDLAGVRLLRREEPRP
jgi:hypothetical protein